MCESTLACLDLAKNTDEAAFQRAKLVQPYWSVSVRDWSSFFRPPPEVAGALAGGLHDTLFVDCGVGLCLRLLDDTARLGTGVGQDSVALTCDALANLNSSGREARISIDDAAQRCLIHQNFAPDGIRMELLSRFSSSSMSGLHGRGAPPCGIVG